MWLRIILLIIVLAVLLRLLRVATRELLVGLKGKDSKYQKINTDSQSTKRAECMSVLGLSGNASRDDIKKAYREKVRKYHPDTVENMEAEFKEIARKKTAEINEAYAFLMKEMGRA